MTAEGHKSGVMVLAANPSFSHLVFSGGADGNIRSWTKEGEVKVIFERGHTSEISALCNLGMYTSN